MTLQGRVIPHPPPDVHRADTGCFSPAGHADENVPSRSRTTQQDMADQDQDPTPSQEGTVENSQIEYAIQDTHTSQSDSPGLPPMPFDRPWLGMQSTHSSHLNTFGIDPSLRFFDPSSIFTPPAHLSHHQQGLGDVHGDTSFGTFDPAPAHNAYGFSSSVVSPIQDQPQLSNSLAASLAPTVERDQTHISTRRGRGDARRGQPRPRAWTSEEEQTLLQMFQEGQDKERPSDIAKRAAKILGKSTSAVEGKYWRLQGGDPKAYKKNCKRQGDPGGYRGGRGGGRGGGGGGRRGGGSSGGIAA